MTVNVGPVSRVDCFGAVGRVFSRVFPDLVDDTLSVGREAGLDAGDGRAADGVVGFGEADSFDLVVSPASGRCGDDERSRLLATALASWISESFSPIGHLICCWVLPETVAIRYVETIARALSADAISNADTGVCITA